MGAIFRVNCLSSFSLGTARIIMILFHAAVSQQPLTIFNIVSQGLNWLITFLYFFANPAVSYMKGVIEVDAMKQDDRQWLRELQKQHHKLLKQRSTVGSASPE